MPTIRMVKHYFSILSAAPVFRGRFVVGKADFSQNHFLVKTKAVFFFVAWRILLSVRFNMSI